MVKRKTWMAALLVAGVAANLVSGYAQPVSDANDPQTLPQYLKYAAQHNVGLKAAFEQWKVAVEQVPQAEALPDPRFSYGYFIEEMDTRQRAGIMQMFPWFGKIEARTDAASAAAKAAQKRFEADRLRLFFDVKDAFHEYAYLASAVRIAKESLALSQHFEEVARAKYVTAAAGHPDIIRAQIRVAELQDRLTTLERLRPPTIARLNAVLNRPAEAPLPWPRAEPVRLVEVDESKLTAALKERNPQLEALRFEVERFRSEVGVAKRNFYPDIGVGLEWMDMDVDGMSGRSGGDDEVVLGVELNLPIWRSSYRAGELQARAMARRAQYGKQDMENDLLARTARVLYEVEDNARKVRLYSDVLVPKAEELIGASETAYAAGTVDFLSLIDAEQGLLEFRLQRERAWANHQQRVAELEMLVGGDVPRVESGQ